jgi:hypothetical protein
MNPLKEIYRSLLLTFNKLSKPLECGVYAVEHGDFVGEFFVYIRTQTDGSYDFLCLPKMLSRNVPAESFTTGIKNKVICFVEKLPKPVHCLCVKQFDNKAPRTPMTVHSLKKKHIKQNY